nr:hypothetical protein [Tanacetum cinerariifolium]
MSYKEPPIPPPGVEQQEPTEEATDTELSSTEDIQPSSVQIEVQEDQPIEELIHQSRGSCVVGLFAVIDNKFEEWAWSCELTSCNRQDSCKFMLVINERKCLCSLPLNKVGFAAVLAVLKLERLKADRARRLLISVLLFTVCEEASKVESCPSEIILDDLLALDSIVRFDLGDRRLEETATFSISTNSK